jgi:hypothetical protein
MSWLIEEARKTNYKLGSDFSLFKLTVFIDGIIIHQNINISADYLDAVLPYKHFNDNFWTKDPRITVSPLKNHKGTSYTTNTSSGLHLYTIYHSYGNKDEGENIIEIMINEEILKDKQNPYRYKILQIIDELVQKFSGIEKPK